MLKNFRAAALGLCLAGLIACGGGGGAGTSTASGSSSGSSNSSSGSTSSSGSSSGTTQPTNVLPITVDLGPGGNSINELFAKVTICTPGSSSACQVIDHVLVDTGSVGLRIIASALNSTPNPTPISDPVSGNHVFECVRFADGYTWGSMVKADVQLGSRTIASMPVNLVGDAASGAITIPSSCASGTNESNVAAFQANGVLGVGNFLQDCGSACSSGTPPSHYYYTCPGGACSPVLVPLDLQAANPVWLLQADNNGLVISLPAVPAAGSTTVAGSLYFGINTQSNNALGAAQLIALDSQGDLVTLFGGSTITQSFLDTGSNAYFFDSSLTVCTTNTDFYCPASATPESAQLQGQNTGVSQSVSFTVSNADSLFQSASISADPGLGGPATPSADGTFSHYFDWGLPFFFNRKVFILFENASIGAVQGPATGF